MYKSAAQIEYDKQFILCRDGADLRDMLQDDGVEETIVAMANDKWWADLLLFSL